MNTHNTPPNSPLAQTQANSGDWRKAFSLHTLDLSPDLRRMARATPQNHAPEGGHWILALPTLRGLVESSQDLAQQVADMRHSGAAITALDVLQSMGYLNTPCPEGLWAKLRFVVRFHRDFIRFQWSAGFQLQALAER